MGTVIGQMRDGVAELEANLVRHGGEWACGERFTLADVEWAASLFRMRWIGAGHLFSESSDHPQVAAYTRRVFARPSFRSAIFDWPAANGPSPWVPEMNTIGFKLRFFWNVLRG